ncbi:MAG: hypothetical protein GVY36_07880 [Verrucomicrobia bacterium]|jgi:hypothetical protein|nr:hypothetical protein [Verrucomicrobiota bacterium]
MSAVSQVSSVFKKYPLAIICFIIFIACAVLTFTRGAKLAELAAQEESLNSRDRVLKRNVKNAVGLEDDLTRAQTVVDAMRGKLFRREERAANANFFYDMEAPFDVRITQINQQGGGYPLYGEGGIHELKLHSTIVFQIGLTGKIENILSFVHHLKEVDPFIRVANLRLAIGNQNEDAGFLECRLNVVVLSELE